LFSRSLKPPPREIEPELTKPIDTLQSVTPLRWISPALMLCATLALTAATAPAQTADAIYFHGNILTGVDLTGVDLDRAIPQRVTALAVHEGTVVAVGTDATILARFKNPKVQLVDLHGFFVMPGLNDAHVHFGEAGRRKLQVDLTGTPSLVDMQSRVKAAAQSAAPGTWLQGGGWDHTLWQAKVTPTRADLDSVTGGHPAIFGRIDGHIAIANSAALTAAGIDGSTPDPQGGKIDRDAKGEATGILREDSAMELVYQKIPRPSDVMRRRGLELAMADAVSHGLTSVQDNSDWEDFLVFEKLEHEGKLSLRVSEWLPFSAPLDQLKQMRASHPADDQMLHTGMLKGFMDGSLGSRTAAMKQPFSDDQANSGIPRYDQARLNEMTVERAAAGFQIGFHAIGDRAASMALEAFAQAEKQNPQRSASLRFRVEHAQVVDPADIERFKALGVIASMQPNHLLTDMNWAEQRLGPDRAKYSYAWKAFLDAGVPLAFGTDYPVEPVTPFRGIYSAITRQNEPGTQTYFSANKLTIGQALFAYTQGSAYAEFAEKWKGKLTPGFVADFVVLDRDLTRVPPADILKTRVLRTVVGGKTVYLGDIKAR
jgi:predicted amidohydrolase YtcJ